MNTKSVTRFMHSRGAFLCAFVLMCAASIWALVTGQYVTFYDNNGLIDQPFDDPITSPGLMCGLNIVMLLILSAMIIYINKVYSIPRTITAIVATSFAVMQTATPAVAVHFSTGTILALVVLGCMMLMYGSFGNTAAQRRVFMVFFLLSLCSAVQYGFMLYIPVFVLGCVQMRMLTVRSLLAMILGLVTPWWILFGFGIVSPDDFTMPSFESVFAAFDAGDMALLLIAVALTFIVTLSAYVLSVLKLMNYNAGTRACNGLLTVVTFLTMVLVIADFNNIFAYLTLLNICAAFMLGHLFVIKYNSKMWITGLALVILYYMIYLLRYVV